jgi:hypothetical protein
LARTEPLACDELVDAPSVRFLLVLDESAIIKNRMVPDQMTRPKHNLRGNTQANRNGPIQNRKLFQDAAKSRNAPFVIIEQILQRARS